MPAARLSETCLLVSWSSYTKFRNNLSAQIYLRVIEADHALNLTKSSGGQSEKWFATIDRLGRDHALFESCIDSNLTECAAAQRLGSIIEDAKAQNGLAVFGYQSRHQP